jgi:hypothetical protein
MGGIVSTTTLWALARHWYANRLAPDWSRRSAQETRELFETLGLVGEFWE